MDTFIEAQNLLKRYREGRAFRHYVEERMPLVFLAVIVFLGYSLATTAATIVFIGGTHGFLTLLAMLIAPFLLIGSLAALLFIFFSWLETRAMARVTGQPALAARHLQSLPALRTALGRLWAPWLVAGAFALLPLIITALVSGKTALALLVGTILAPVAFSLLDR
jgi:uncharacterized membrane protein